MYEQLSRADFELSAEQSRRVVVFKEISFDHITPVAAYYSLTTLYPEACKEGIALLESASPADRESHFSVLAYDFEATFRARGMQIEMQDALGKRKIEGELFSAMRRFVSQYATYTNKHFPPAVGGVVGFLAYDFIRNIETIPDQHANNEEIDDVFLASPRKVLVFDHHRKKLSLCVIIDHEEGRYEEAMVLLDQIDEDLRSSILFPKKTSYPLSSVEEEISEEDFKGVVEKAKEYLRKGDAFQIVLSRSFRTKVQSHPFTIYRALRNVNPSPFMFYLQTPDFSLAGASPERLVKVKDRKIETMPIAGTRPRGKDPRSDADFEQELLADPKENAEHMMLVDLGRNDIGRVAQIGTVSVSQLRKVERYSHVMHMVSEVQGVLKDEYDVIDAIRALFPASTLSGAPKIRAMEIIDELEVSRRGVYGGAILMMNADGELDSCIAIRMAYVRDQVATVRAGAGIVLDSDPEMEAKETCLKASAILAAIRMAEEGKV